MTAELMARWCATACSLLFILVVGLRSAMRLPRHNGGIDTSNLFLRSRIIRKLTLWALNLATSGVDVLKNGNRLLAKALRASGMEWCLIALRRLVCVQENAGSWLHQRVAFEAAVLVALIFKLSNCLATFFQNQVSHLLRIQQSLLKCRQMVTNIEEDRVHLSFLSDAFDGLDEIKRRLDGVDAKFKFSDHSGSSNSSTRFYGWSSKTTEPLNGE